MAPALRWVTATGSVAETLAGNAITVLAAIKSADASSEPALLSVLPMTSTAVDEGDEEDNCAMFDVVAVGELG